MVTYISLLLGALSAIVGALLSPKVKGKRGKEHFSKWAAAFVVLPIVAFAVAAIDTSNKDEDQKKQVVSLNQRLDSSTKQTRSLTDQVSSSKELIKKGNEVSNSLRTQVQLSNEVIASGNDLTRALQGQVRLSNAIISSLQTRVETSIHGVDVIEAKVTFTFLLRQAGFSRELPESLRALTIAELVGYEDKSGKLRLGVQSNMFDFVPLPDGYGRVSSLISQGLIEMRNTPSPVLMIARRGSSRQALGAVAEKGIQFLLPGVPAFDQSALPSTVATYEMTNPRALPVIPPLYIALAQEAWFIPDHEASDPSIDLTWRFRFLNNKSVGLITADDFKGADVELFAYRLHPDRDESPNRISLGEPFGYVSQVEVSAGGNVFAWWEDGQHSNERIVRYEDPRHSTQDFGQLIHLTPGKHRSSDAKS